MPLLRPTLRPSAFPRLIRRTHSAPTPPAPPSAPRRLARQLFAPVAGFFAFYGASQRAHPWITQIITSTTIHALGDANAQLLFPAEDGADGAYDVARTARMVATGGALAIPTNSFYTRISYCFTRMPAAAGIALRVALSQAVFTPLYLVGFFSIQGVLEGHSAAQIEAKIWSTGMRAWRDGLVVWPAVSTVNFAVVPIEYRALVGGVASLGWNTWLSYLNSRTPVTAASPDEIVAAAVPIVVEKVQTSVLSTTSA